MEDAKMFTAGDRMKAASKGQAMPGGSFPIKTAADLKNAISAYGRAKNKAAAKAHIMSRAKALGLTKSLPADWASADCPECARQFLDAAALGAHAQHVHWSAEPGTAASDMAALETFEDIRRVVSQEVQTKYGRPSNYTVTPSITGVYTYVCDLSPSWVVFESDGSPGGSQLLKADYSIENDAVTLGTPVEVVRRTVYEEVS